MILKINCHECITSRFLFFYSLHLISILYMFVDEIFCWCLKFNEIPSPSSICFAFIFGEFFFSYFHFKTDKQIFRQFCYRENILKLVYHDICSIHIIIVLVSQPCTCAIDIIIWINWFLFDSHQFPCWIPHVLSN